MDSGGASGAGGMMATDIDSFETRDPVASIVAVSLQPAGHLFDYLAGSIPLKRGDRVLVDGEAGVRLATVEVEPHEPTHTIDLSALKPVLKLADEEDLRLEEQNLELEAYARRICLHRIHERSVPAKLVNVNYSHDGRKATFFFVAEHRLDLRELVRDLANTLRVRIDMNQIGAREETKSTGGIGPCGRELCCSSWLRDFESVTVKMAREQDLALNPSRLAGMCGRLKCCLRYEFATYVELKKGLPAVGKHATSVKGDGKVIRLNVLKQTVLIQRDEDGGVVEAALSDLVEPRPT